MADVHAVADYILTKIDADAGDAITHLKLQKLVYYAQAWSLVLLGGELFSDKIEAWAHGPAVWALWQRFKQYGWQAIDPTALVSDPFTALTEAQRELIDQVWDTYGDLSGSELRALTHSEDPWRDAYGDRPVGASCDEVISLDAMRVYYARKLEAAS